MGPKPMTEPACLLVIHRRGGIHRKGGLSPANCPTSLLHHISFYTDESKPYKILCRKRTCDQSTPSMASSTARLTFRIVFVVLFLLFLFYAGRPLYWKISATIHEIRQNKQTVRQGISQIVQEAQRSVGW